MRCPKCASTSITGNEFRNTKWSIGKLDYQVHCIMCGFILYGDAARNFMEKDRQAELDRAEQKRLASLPPKIPKCAWHKCTEPRRTTSIYCSRKCCVENAHAREAERYRARKGKNANVSPVQGVSSDGASAGRSAIG